MSTRRLILTALVCGLAILVAGGIQLFRLKDSDPVELPGLGESRTVGGVQVTVVDVSDLDATTVVEVTIRAVEGGVTGSAGDGWTLLRRTTFPSVPPPAGSSPPACTAVALTEQVQQCIVVFDAPGNDARFLAYRRGEVEARWALDAG